MTREEVFHAIQNLVVTQFSVDGESVTDETSFEEDLGADSIDLVDLVMAMEEEFDVGEIDEEELGNLKTVGDAVDFIFGKLN